jgi:hypothetical protein
MTKFYCVDYVTCIDEEGKRSMFPVNITDLHKAYDGIAGGECMMTIDDFLSLKELAAKIAPPREV